MKLFLACLIYRVGWWIQLLGLYLTKAEKSAIEYERLKMEEDYKRLKEFSKQ